MNQRTLRKPSKRITGLLADNVTRLRKNRAMSQERLAEKSGLHRTYVGSVERGERNVTLSTLEALADALSVSVTYLLTDTTTKDE